MMFAIKDKVTGEIFPYDKEKPNCGVEHHGGIEIKDVYGWVVIGFDGKPYAVNEWNAPDVGGHVEFEDISNGYEIIFYNQEENK